MYEKILVGYDGTYHSKKALDIAIEMAESFNSELYILTVIPELIIPVFPDEGYGVGYPNIPVRGVKKDITDYSDKAEEVYGKILNLAFEDLVEKHPELKVIPKLSEGNPPTVIIELADAIDVDLIVMGCRGMGTVKCMILGSTSRRVVESCERPILIVKGSE
jgi:nucleotide-binding universal stress UspA family protein